MFKIYCDLQFMQIYLEKSTKCSQKCVNCFDIETEAADTKDLFTNYVNMHGQSVRVQLGALLFTCCLLLLD